VPRGERASREYAILTVPELFGLSVRERHRYSRTRGELSGWTPETHLIMPKTRINGIDIYYEAAGNGHPFVFVHGGHLESSSWRPQVAHFSKRYQVVTYDIRGHGRSEVPEEGYSMADCVEDLHQLLDHLAVEQAYLTGLSMGGYIALSFTLAHPERVSALILAGTNSGPVTGKLRMWGEERAARMRKKATDSARKFVRAHEATLARADLTGRLPEIRKPTLIIVGERDNITPRGISEVMLREIAGSRIVVIPDCGHSCHEEQPDTFNSIVTEFLDGVESA
jgi:3-oxoadipate enol-lactonase